MADGFVGFTFDEVMVMEKQVVSRMESPSKRTSEFSSVSDGGMFESRPFVVQSKEGEEGKKSGLKTSLMQAERYGHHVSKIAGIDNFAVQNSFQQEEKEGQLPPNKKDSGFTRKGDIQKKGEYTQNMSEPARNQRAKEENNIELSQKKENEVLQRAVPIGGERERPVANTGNYNPRGQDEIFNDTHQKPDFRQRTANFPGTREAVLTRYNPQYAGNRIISIRTASGVQVNVEGVHIDHQISWESMRQTMLGHNNRQPQPRWFYTLRDARLYYNDLDNLVPELGGINAAAGINGVRNLGRNHPFVEFGIGSIKRSFMNLQAGIESRNWPENEAEELTNELMTIKVQMDELTDRLFEGRNGEEENEMQID
ncbi:MAG: hypothetical protein U7127_04890 [Phormidium sp.]